MSVNCKVLKLMHYITLLIPFSYFFITLKWDGMNWWISQWFWYLAVKPEVGSSIPSMYFLDRGWNWGSIGTLRAQQFYYQTLQNSCQNASENAWGVWAGVCAGGGGICAGQQVGVCAGGDPCGRCACECMCACIHMHVPSALKNVENIWCGPHAQKFRAPCTNEISLYLLITLLLKCYYIVLWKGVICYK